MNPRAKKPKGGGVKNLQRLMGLRQDGVLPTDVIFVSIDVEVDEDRQKLHLLDRDPIINQVGIATLDSRDLQFLPPSANLDARISVRLFQAAERRPKKEHPTLVPTMITQKEFVYTVTTNLYIDDNLANVDGEHSWRNIALVGHSIWEDIKILRIIGLDITSIAPILTVFDTHSISRFLFPPYHPTIPILPGQDFSLAAILAEFGHRIDRSQFHNAASDAAYTLRLMVSLAIKSGVARGHELSITERGNLTKLEQAFSLMINRKPPATLGAGLWEAANESLLDSNSSGTHHASSWP